MRRFIVLIPTFIFALVLALGAGGILAYNHGLDSLAKEGNTRMELYISYLRGVLEKYESLPELLATNKQLVNFFQNPGSRERINALNLYLETINTISDASDTYLMNRDGLTIAASNWNTPKPFVGRNFSYRPYFKQAMEGKLGRYFALGTTSSERGYYFAYPVRYEGKILGAVVIKIKIDSIEENWSDQKADFLVVDPDGVIFITTREPWRFRTMGSLDPQVKKRLAETQRYPNASLLPLNLVEQHRVEQGKVIQLKLEESGKIKSFLLQEAAMDQAGWKVYALSKFKPVETQVIYTLISIVGAAGLAALTILLYWQHQQQVAERQKFIEDNRRMLQEANEQLEIRVVERTAALTETNDQLRQEIAERQKTEEELRKTRRELIHAAKLAALGQMSTVITHELNQPLAAIRSYTDNAVQFLAKNRIDNVEWNLEQIKELTERMGGLAMQLKIFARKSSGKLNIVPLHGVLDGAMEMMAPVLAKSGVKLSIDMPQELEGVRANAVLLQQVLVNLISNAIQAVAEQDKKKVSIEVVREEDTVLLRVQDNGPGIDPAMGRRIFEPFFTTKDPGKGLGLGLTISARIMEDMGGRIRLVHTGVGACFEITLNREISQS
ncbi:sensor histidine kinase [Desulfobulbus rhabdoformis]|uniref:sensor histidine kinase n=1 Tax=Desulfobulbus rhabdoformis TaxID=34032 RepID=UPI0019625758|nr:ATP-binding protein [Desulfobulbus rhabdoformis]MBM9612723.1 sensor histidine kinase [Desulfobulbus rhabdoformis]